MLNVAFCCALLVLATSCFFGDKVGNKRKFLLTLPPHEQSAFPSAAGSPAVREALRLIDSVLVREGMVANSNPPPSATNAVAYYSKDAANCKIYLTDGSITVVCFEYSRGVSSADFDGWTGVLQQELKHHYGAQNVKAAR